MDFSVFVDGNFCLFWWTRLHGSQYPPTRAISVASFGAGAQGVHDRQEVKLSAIEGFFFRPRACMIEFEDMQLKE